jgi:transposase
MRYELSDQEWSIIRAMLPTKPRGIPRVDDRRVLNGIFWVLRSGAPWRDLPPVYGPRTTCYNRFVRWRRAGIWDTILQALTRVHDAAVQMIDTSTGPRLRRPHSRWTCCNAWHRVRQVAHPGAVGLIFGHCPGPIHKEHGSADRAAAKIRCLQLQPLFERKLNERWSLSASQIHRAVDAERSAKALSGRFIAPPH